MKPVVWNINELMNMPSSSGGIKTGKGSGINDHSRLTDSQYLLGSQCWSSQEMNGQSGGSQKTSQSQEMKKMTVASNYSSKPLLFGGDGKIPNFTANAVDMFEKFEEAKRIAKEKSERENLALGILQLQQSLESIRETLLSCFEGNCDTTRKVLLERMDNFSKTIEDYLSGVREGITCQFETLQSQTQIGTEDWEAKVSLATKDLNSNMLNLQQDVEHVKAEQSKEQGMLGKILSQLDTLIAIHNPIAEPITARMIDSEVQTSPGLLERVSVISADKNEGVMLCPLKPHNRNTDVLSVQGRQHFKQTEVMEELTRTSQHVDLQPTASDQRREYSDRPLVHAEPEKPLHESETRQRSYTDAFPPPKVLRRRQKFLNFRGKKRALVLPQRQPVKQKLALKISKDSQQNEDLRSDQKDRVSPSSACDSWKITNKSVAENNFKPHRQASVAPVNQQLLNPFSMWSQDTNSSQMIVEYKMTEWEPVIPKVNVMREGGLWQLFDFNNDSE